MEQNTPIQNLQQSNEGEDDSRIVQSILQEMKHQEGSQQNLPEQSNTPQMQVMPQGQQPQYMQPEPEYEPDDVYDSYDDVQEFKKQSLVDTILKEVREPIVVILLYVATNLPMINKLITKYIPKTVTNTGNVNLIGTSLKAIIVAILFYIIKKFLC